MLSRLWRPRRKEIPKHKPDPERPSRPRSAREMLCLLAKRFPAHKIHGVGDAAYANGAFAGLPENVTMTSRLRSDAALHRLAPPRPPKGQRKRGRPPKKKERSCQSWRRSPLIPPPIGSRRPSAATARPST